MELKYSDDKKIFTVHRKGIPYLSSCMLDSLGVPNLFSTRFVNWDEEKNEGAEGLRTTLMAGDDISEAAPVIQDIRDRLARQLGSSLDFECVTDQKHTSFVHVAAENDLGIRWPRRLPLHRQYVDGVVTDLPDALLTVFGGDCPPVYLADPVRKAVGLVHAGRKGTLGRIPAVAIARMIVNFGCDPADMYAVIGPGICVDCYEMGDEIYDEFEERWGHDDAERILKRYPSGRYHLDLREANRMTLLRAGVPEDHISVSNVCTACNADKLYSYRAGRLENEGTAMIVNRWEK
ncbi:MAG: laccase domain-containing protein [Mogibacterium sp.]|nr:laccase domain-containing protein [Mogibacterium sp.]